MFLELVSFVKMMTFLKILQVFLIFLEVQQVSSVVSTLPECESPCMNGQTCEVSCTAVSGTITTGLVFYLSNTQLVTCTNMQCNTNFPTFYNYTHIDSKSSSLQILNFDNATLSGLYECADGSGASQNLPVYEVLNADIPQGNLTGDYSNTTGLVTCTIAHVGTAILTMKYPNGTNLMTNASTVVTAVVHDVSYVTCSLDWPTCPKYINRKFPLIIINTTAPTTEPPSNVGTSDSMSSVASTSSAPSSASSSASTGTPDSGCICRCRCKCTVVIALVVCLAILTAALFGWSIFLCCIYGGKCPLNCERKTLTAITIALIVITVAFIIAVGAYSLNCESECNCAGCNGNPCCNDTYCPDAYKASIAFVVLGCIAVIFAILALVLPKYCCCKERMESALDPTTDAVPLKNQPPSVARSSGNTRSQDSNPPSDPPKLTWMLKKFVLVNFIKERKTHLVHREWLSQGVSDSQIEMFCAKWPPEKQEQLAQQGAAPSQEWELCSVGITSTTDNFSLATVLLQDSDKKDTQEQPGRDFSFTTQRGTLKQGFIPKNFVLVEVMEGRKTCVVHHSWLLLRKEDNGLESLHATLPPEDVEKLAEKGAKPTREWKQNPVMILASTDDFQLVMKRLHDIQKKQGKDPNKGGSNGEKLPSPQGQLPPLKLPENTDNDQPQSEKKKKKKKTKRDQPESEESRPLPMPSEAAMEVRVNMSGSNISPLPTRNNFTPGHQSSGQSEYAMTPVGSSSLKKT